MNKFYLHFEDNKLENDFQQHKLENLQVPVFRITIILIMFLNVVKILVDIIYYKNIGYSQTNFIIFAILFIFLMIVQKKIKNLKIVIVIANLLTSFLELYFNSYQHQYVTFNYGSCLQLLQAILYFITDFPDCLIQCLFHISAKIIICNIYANTLDITSLLMGIAFSGLLLQAIYISDQSSRTKFLLKEQDTRWEMSLQKVVCKPFYLFTYDKIMQKFNVLLCQNQEQFPYYDKDLCYGCNFRMLLRTSQIYNRTLESLLIDHNKELMDNLVKLPLFQQKKYRYKLKFYNVGIEQLNCLVILDEIIIADQTIIQSCKLKQNVFKEINNQSQFIFQKHQLFGAYSLLFLNSNLISQVKFTEIFKRMSQFYQKSTHYQITVLQNCKNIIQIITYKNQLTIFLNQLFLILVQINKSTRKFNFIINVHQFNVRLKILTGGIYEFKELYNNNYYIQQIKNNLLFQEIDEKLEIVFLKEVSQYDN